MLDVDRLEVAVLERGRPNRTFRRITAAALASLLPSPASTDETPAQDAVPADDGPEPPATPHSPGDKG